MYVSHNIFRKKKNYINKKKKIFLNHYIFRFKYIM